MPEKRKDEIVVGCSTMKAEYAAISEKTGIERDAIWLESGLHNTPDILVKTLQDTLDSITGRARVLFIYGNCGNVVQGLRTGDFELIIPRIDDCISMLFGSQEKREAASEEYAAIYITEGWMDTGHNINDEYRYAREKFDDEMADRIFKMMYEHYRTMAFLDTGLYDIPALEDKVRDMTSLLGLEHKVLPATLSYVQELVAGPWPEERFVHVPPHAEVPARAFRPAST